MKDNLYFTHYPYPYPIEVFVLAREEEEKIIRQSYQHPLGFLIRFLMSTGIKAEELLLLIYSDINVMTREVDIPIVLKPGTDINKAASTAEFRAVPIPDRTMVELADWRSAKMRACEMNEYDISHEPIATTPEGNRITYQGLQRIFCDILYDCDMIYYPLSALRDTYAMRLLAGGIVPQALNEILGDPNAANIYINYSAAIGAIRGERPKKQRIR